MMGIINNMLNTYAGKLLHFIKSLTGIKAHFLQFFFFITLLVSFSDTAYAADMTFECKGNTCTKSGATSFFGVNTVIPGESVSKTLEVKNKKSIECSAYIFTNNANYQSVDVDFIKSLKSSITYQNKTVFPTVEDPSANSLYDIFVSTAVKLDDIKSDSSKTFTWSVVMPEGTSNDTQGRNVTFDINVLLVCDDSDIQTEEEYEYYEEVVYVDGEGNIVDPDDYKKEETSVVNRVLNVLGIANSSNESNSGESGEVEGTSSERNSPSAAFIDAMLRKLSAEKGQDESVDEERGIFCVGSKSWLWFFLIQAVFHFLVTYLMKINTKVHPVYFYGIQLANLGVFMYIFLFVFCP